MPVLLYVLWDVIVLYVSFVLGFAMRFGGFPFHNWHVAVTLSPFSAITSVILSYLLDLHRPYTRRTVTEIILGQLVCNLLSFVSMAAVWFWLRAFSIPLSALLVIFLINAVLRSVFGILYLHFVDEKRTTSTLLVASDDRELRWLKSLVTAQDKPFLVEGLTAPYPEWRKLLSQCDQILIGPGTETTIATEMIKEALNQGKMVRSIPNSYNLIAASTEIDFIGETLALSYRPIEIPRYYQALKRLMDIVISLLMLVATSPITLILAVSIRITSRGPIIFRQTRVGMNGTHFEIYKFRSMVVDAEKHTGAVLATANDPRVTKVGRFMRATRLDEIPQLYNVLRGDMSIIGPRPERPEFLAQFAKSIPGYDLRHRVRPGITGFAQVMANYTTEPADKLRYDLWYVQHCSLILDLKILLRTIIVVLQPQRARGITIPKRELKHTSSQAP